MFNQQTRILVTGANGKLGQLVIDSLLKTTSPTQITATVRNAKTSTELSAKGVRVIEADYAKPETLDKAFAGIDHLLLISSSEVGQRAPQHQNVINAAKRAGVKLLAYTSILHVDKSPLGLAEEHLQTEAAIRASGIPFVLLRNSWYTENYAASAKTAIARGVFLGAAGHGKIASAARADYAAAAAAVLTSSADQAGRIYELAGDEPYTLSQLAAEISRQSGKPVAYENLTEADFKAALIKAGLPEHYAALLADSDTGASKGALFDDSHQLGKLIGRPTTPLATVVAEALK